MNILHSSIDSYLNLHNICQDNFEHKLNHKGKNLRCKKYKWMVFHLYICCTLDCSSNTNYLSGFQNNLMDMWSSIVNQKWDSNYSRIMCNHLKYNRDNLECMGCIKSFLNQENILLRSCINTAISPHRFVT